jgi:hypothetical protein
MGALITSSVRSGGGGLLLAGLGRLREALAEGPQLLVLSLAELRVPGGQVAHRLVEPRGLVFRFGANDAALHDVLEQFVASFLEWGRRRGWSALPVVVSDWFGHE